MTSRRPTFRSNLLLLGVGSILVLFLVAQLSLRESTQLVGGSPDKVLVIHTNDEEADNDTSSVPLVGQWVHVGSNRTFAAPVCCGWDKGDFKHHPQECGAKRTDSNFYTGTPALGPYQQTGGMACRRGSGRKDKFIDEWQWQSPELPTFNAKATCQQLGDRTVLLLGDSTMQQAASTLMNALKLGGCSPQIKIQLSDTLIHRNLGNLNRGLYFRKALKQHQSDIAILSAGAHVRTDYNYTSMLDELIQGIQEWRANPNNSPKKKPMTFVWKTQQPGGCTSEIVQPEDPVHAAREFDFSHTPQYQLHEYDNFYRRDLYTMQRWKNELGDDAHILDMRMLYSRSDAHPGSGQADPLDCLHFLAPGPLDVVAPLFQRLLVDIDRAQ